MSQVTGLVWPMPELSGLARKAGIVGLQNCQRPTDMRKKSNPGRQRRAQRQESYRWPPYACEAYPHDIARLTGSGSRTAGNLAVVAQHKNPQAQAFKELLRKPVQ